MLKPVSEIIENSVGIITYKNKIVTGKVAVDNGHGSYDVYISEGEEAYPNIYTLVRNPTLAIGDKVRILYEGGNKEKPIILPPEIALTYTVTYDGNGASGGTAPIDSNLYYTGDLVTILDKGSLTNAGLYYIFDGWNTVFNGSGTFHYPSGTFNMGTSNVILYAIWVAPV